ncbi:MAG TPA: alpha/beta fold hydrolase [Macromonas sp.]|nr:alpha/beta fold hydrolase [Macromonas sp.]
METYIRTPDGLSLWVQTFGHVDRPALLLVMGVMNQGIFWPDNFCEQLANAGYRVIRYDHRDTGRSTCLSFVRHPYTLGALTRDAVAVLDGLGIGQADVLGLSMGGFIAQLLALEHPQRLRKAVLLSTSADHRPYAAALLGLPTALFTLPPPEPGFVDTVRQMRRHLTGTPEAERAATLRAWEAIYAGPRPFPRQAVLQAVDWSSQRAVNPRAAMNHGLAVGLSKHRLKRVQDIGTPTLVLHGRYDPCLPLAHGEYLARQIPGARLQVLDMGHAFMWSWDAEVARAVLEFLR